MLTGDGSRLVGIDPASGLADAPVDLGVLGSDIAVTDTAVWVISRLDGATVRVDPTTRAITGRVDGIDQPVGVAAGDQVWAGCRTATTGIDPATATVVDTIDAGVGLDGAITVDGSTLWVRDADHFLRRIDLSSGKIESVNGPATSGGDVLVAFGSVWATANEEELLFRLPIA